MVRIKTVIFDIDDTIYAFNPVHKKALYESYTVYKKYDPISFRKFKTEFNHSWDIIKKTLKNTPSRANRILIFQNLVERRSKKFNASLILSLYDRYWNCFLKNARLHVSVLDLFRFLKKRGIRIGLISDLTTVIQLKKIRKFRILRYIDAFAGAEECGENKPSPRLFRIIMKKLHMAPNKTIMVGDNASVDIYGARKLGITTIQLLGGSFSKKMSGSMRADYYTNNFRGIKQIINKIC